MARINKIPYKTKKGIRYSWRVTYKDRNGKLQQPQFKTKAEANAHDESISVQNDPNKIMVEAAGKSWLDTVRTVGRNGRPPVSRGTAAEYERILKAYINPHFEGVRLCRLRPPDIVQFRTKMLESTGRTQAKQALTTLTMVCNEMITQGVLSYNPCQTVKLVLNAGRHKKNIEMPEPSAVQKLLKDTKNEEVGVLIDLMVNTGVRPSEALGLPIKELSLSAKKIRISQSLSKKFQTIEPVKTAAGNRTIPIPASTTQRLRKYTKGREDGLVFLSAEGGPIDYHNFMARVWRPLLKQHNIPYFGLKGLRHYHASLMIFDGRNPLDVAKRLGHSDPGFTLRTYAHLFNEYEAKKVAP